MSHPVSETRYKLGPASEDDKQKLQLLYNACRGIPQVATTKYQSVYFVLEQYS